MPSLLAGAIGEIMHHEPPQPNSHNQAAVGPGDQLRPVPADPARRTLPAFRTRSMCGAYWAERFPLCKAVANMRKAPPLAPAWWDPDFGKVRTAIALPNPRSTSLALSMHSGTQRR
jgi:hypothetical protein